MYFCVLHLKLGCHLPVQTVRELEERQKELESKAPLMRLRVDDFRSQVGSGMREVGDWEGES